ncbi:MAG: SH3 domain-containing protein, partial [Christensenellales bacterium]
MKKTLSLLLALMMAFSLVAVLPTAAAAATKGTVKLSSGTLNVRKTASTSAAVVDKVKNGDVVTVT